MRCDVLAFVDEATLNPAICTVLAPGILDFYACLSDAKYFVLLLHLKLA